MFSNIYKKIYNKIKKYDNIIIARHVGADPDALGSQIGLRDIILNTFPQKKVFAVGLPSSKFKYLGSLDKIDEIKSNSLLIVVDTPDLKRVDGINIADFKDSVKIDHHPFIEKFCTLEWIDDTASSASQMIIELVFNTKLKLSREAAEKLYMGLVSDTNRFMFSYTSPKTFDLIAKLIKETNINFTSLYDNLYLRPYKEIKFQGYIENNLKITENGFAYIKINNDLLKDYNVDAATPGNLINNLNFIEEIYAWAFFTEDSKNNIIRGSIRSRGPVINDVASKYNGGGHIYASGVRFNTLEECDSIINDLDERCKEYKEKVE